MSDRIVMLLPDFVEGGAERNALHLAAEFAQAGRRAAFVVMRKEGELLDEARERPDAHPLDASRIRQVPGALFGPDRKAVSSA